MIGKTNYSDWRALLFWIYSLEHVFLEILHILIIKLLNIINMLSIVIVPIPKDLSCVPKLWQIIVLQIAGGSEKIAPDRGLIVVAASIFLQIAKCISPYIAKCICHKIQGAQSQSHKKHKQTKQKVAPWSVTNCMSCWIQHPSKSLQSRGIALLNLQAMPPMIKGIVHNFFIFGQISYFE